jgi:hypothetical protein
MTLSLRFFFTVYCATCAKRLVDFLLNGSVSRYSTTDANDMAIPNAARLEERADTKGRAPMKRIRRVLLGFD